MYQPPSDTQSIPSNGLRIPLSPAYKVFTLFSIMFLDVALYTIIFPLIATYLSGACAKTCNLPMECELILTVFLTFVIVNGVFSVSSGELAFWKYLFTLDPFYCNILKIRDGANSIIFIVTLVSLGSTVESMLDDKFMKPQHISEGTGYFFVKSFFRWLSIDPAVLPHLGLTLPHNGTILDPDFGENGRYENGAAYMYFWAVLTACVAKLIYFNTLFTYLMSMEVFIAMNPTFG